MSSPTTAPPLDPDQIAGALAGLRPGWIGQGLIAGPLTWRDARASWPRPLLTDRSAILEPESVGITLTAADDRQGRLVIWRGGWADIDVLADRMVTQRTRSHGLLSAVFPPLPAWVSEGRSERGQGRSGSAPHKGAKVLYLRLAPN